MASRELDDLDARFKPIVEKALSLWNDPQTGLDVRLTCTLRSFAEQDYEYSRGRTTPGVPCTHDGVIRPIGACEKHPLGLSVTAAKAGMSWHNYGLAIDVAPFVANKPVWSGVAWSQIEDIGKKVGMRWGGDWVRKDRPHFEWHPGYEDSGKFGPRMAKKRWEMGKRPIPLNGFFDDVTSGGSTNA